MNPLYFLFHQHRLKEVFTPSTVAKLTYVPRLNVETDVAKFLQMPGMQIVLYGHSGCGKSTLIYNKLLEYNINSINTSCTSDTTFDELVLQAFDKLNVYYLHESTKSCSVSVSLELKARDPLRHPRYRRLLKKPAQRRTSDYCRSSLRPKGWQSFLVQLIVSG